LNVSSAKIPTTFGGIKFVSATLQHAFDRGLAGLILVGSDGREPARASVPPALIASLNLTSLAAWSLKEERRMNGRQAYECLRRISRQRRIPLSQLAEDLLGAARFP
jgi:hypothetical protein